jgi:hypothetical protein
MRLGVRLPAADSAAPAAAAAAAAAAASPPAEAEAEPEPDSEVADCDADDPAPESKWGWEACTVVDRNADGTIDVRIADDGALCRGVQARFVRALGRRARMNWQREQKKKRVAAEEEEEADAPPGAAAPRALAAVAASPRATATARQRGPADAAVRSARRPPVELPHIRPHSRINAGSAALLLHSSLPSHGIPL